MPGERLKELRKQRKLTQEQLGKLVGVSGAYIQQLETGKKLNPTYDVAIKIAEVLNATVDELFPDGFSVTVGHRGVGKTAFIASLLKQAGYDKTIPNLLTNDYSSTTASKTPRENKSPYWDAVDIIFKSHGYNFIDELTDEQKNQLNKDIKVLIKLLANTYQQ